MRITIALFVVAFAAACVKSETNQERAADTAQRVTFVGCVEQGATPDEFVLRGRATDQQVVATTGSQPGGLDSTETLRGGDADRTPTRGGTREDWGERLSPKLVATAGQDFRNQLGRRIVVTGEFVPASMEQSLDELKVESLSQVASSCFVQ